MLLNRKLIEEREKIKDDEIREALALEEARRHEDEKRERQEKKKKPLKQIFSGYNQSVEVKKDNKKKE